MEVTWMCIKSGLGLVDNKVEWMELNGILKQIKSTLLSNFYVLKGSEAKLNAFYLLCDEYDS